MIWPSFTVNQGIRRRLRFGPGNRAAAARGESVEATPSPRPIWSHCSWSPSRFGSLHLGGFKADHCSAGLCSRPKGHASAADTKWSNCIASSCAIGATRLPPPSSSIGLADKTDDFRGCASSISSASGISGRESCVAQRNTWIRKRARGATVLRH